MKLPPPAVLLATASLVLLSASPSDGSLVAYEGFDYGVGALGSANGGTGWQSAWTSNGTTNVVATDLSYSTLTTGGGSIGNLSASQNRFGGSREINLGATGAGLLDGGDELWFSMMVGFDPGGNRTNSTLMVVLGDEAMSGGNFDYNYNTADATGLGVALGRLTGGNNGDIRAVQIRDTTFGSSGFAGNVIGSGANDPVLPGANTNLDYAFVVGRITWDGGVGNNEDTIDLFLPDASLNLGSVHSTLIVDIDQSGFDTLTFKRGDRVVLDEIRFGSSQLDVMPVPEPSAMLLGLGGLVLLLRRRR